MKKITTILGIGLLTFGLSLSTAFAQAPEKMSYQAVIRNANNALVQTQGVGIQVTILKGGASGTPVFVETHNVTTNINGLVSLEIGTGAVVSGDFTTIDWASDTYFIQTETDPTTAGGTTYTITGTTQLMSVPYALHAKTAESILGSSIDSFYLGQDTLGGIVFYIYKDAIGVQHGLIVNKTESTAAWQATGVVTNATRSWDGAYNTGLMTSSAAATYVTGLSVGGFTDWYLPSIDELRRLYANRDFANKALNAIGGATLLSNTASYWSSTEYTTANAFNFHFSNGYATNNPKNNTNSVRAVRAF